jgi:hypothetical protein
MSFADPWEDIFEERNADSFVDDTSNRCNDGLQEEAMPYTEPIAKAQVMAQIWERILYSSGGALELRKCFWYLLYWTWENGRLQLATKIECPGIIALTSGHVPYYAVIPRLEVWEARRTLGVRLAPDGNYQKEAAFLFDKANQYAVRLSTSRLSEMDTFIFHRSMYTPSMTYSLPVTTINLKTLNRIQRRAIQAILHKLGVSKAFPRRVAFGPKDLCGMSLLDMSVEQGVRGIQHFTNHLFWSDSVGNLILIALRSLQIESGSGFHLLEHPSEWVPYIAKCWLTCIREFLASNKITLKVASAKLVRKSRQHDCHIMDVVRKLEMYNHEQLFDINAVRMHLQITTLSDIADANGRKITDKAFKGQKLSDRYSRLKWPRQPIITSKQRNLWKAALEAAFTSSGTILKQPLGEWTGPPTQVWRNVYNPRTKRIVISTPGSTPRFTEYTVHQRTRHHVDATLTATASTYVSLEEVDWNIMVPASMTTTQTRT